LLLIKFLFYFEFFVISEATTVLNVYLSINHKNDDFNAFIDADRGAEYIRASYPNPSPGKIFFLTTPLISKASFPSWRMKKQLALLFCFMRYWPSIILHNLNFSRRRSRISFSEINCENVKWAFRLFIMTALSLEVFFS